MNPIVKALDDVKFRIPRQILNAVFVKPSGNWRQMMPNLDEQIMLSVIRPRVLIDCNLVGGVEVYIPLESIPRERVNDYTSVYKIAKQHTQGRSILSALNITFSDPTKASSYGLSAMHDSNHMLRTGQAMMDAMGTIPVTSTASVQLIGENIVMVRDTIVLPANIFLRCILANDENMNHIQPRSYPFFSKLVEYAVKAFIYNEYIIQLDMGELSGGQSLGVFKEIITGYADANELYETYLRETWQAVAFCNDRETYTRFLRMLIGGNR